VKPSSSRGKFYAVLVVIAIIGAAAIVYLTKNPQASSDDGASAQAAYAALQGQYAKAGPPQPYVMGNPKAPVVIEEFADFECPVCGAYATVTEADVRSRIINAGLAYYKYYDFLISSQWSNSEIASNAAACADDQGKFWQMHDRLFAGQDQWGLTANEASQLTDNPVPIFEGYAKDIGLNTTQFNQCLESRKDKARVIANAAEGHRRGVNQTPTFYINGKRLLGGQTYDAIKGAVDEAAAAAKAAPTRATDSSTGAATPAR
jgi:protein-disulfide isomerase